MTNSSIWSVMFVLAALAAGCGKGPGATGLSQEMKVKLIQPGEFMMGSSDAERKQILEETRAAGDEWAVPHIESERPQHRVKLSKPFYLGKYEVTPRLQNVA